MPEGKEKIKSRMIKTASSLWGYNELQPEDSFDPIVGLLIGACAAELEKINREISETESRLIERLIELLTPGTITSSFPAHAILHIRPQKSDVVVDNSYQFYSVKRSTNLQTGKLEEKQVFFMPTGSFKLLDAEVRYLAIKNCIYEFSESEFKEMLFESEEQKRLASNRFWIGLEWKYDMNGPHQIPFYINSKSSFSRELLMQVLPRISWYYRGQKLECSSGFAQVPGSEESPVSRLENDFDILNKILNYTKRYYQDHFITLRLEGIDVSTENVYEVPAEFKVAFTEKQLGNLDSGIVWIEAHSPLSLDEGMAEELLVFLNAVPVINCKLSELTASTRESINIIPLHTDELFLDLKSVMGKNGELYQSRFFSGMNQLKPGSLLLRQGNIGRFDAIQAKEYLEYLLELLKDESAAFNVIGSDLLHADLKELSQVIARFEKKITEVEISRSGNQYLIVRPLKGDDLVFVQFWSTDGPQANHIKAGTPLQIYSGKDVMASNLKLLTSTRGGKERPGREERVNVYRSALLSKNRIITEEDIKTLCYEHVGKEISRVYVKKGIAEGSSSLQGFIRTIDVTIKLHEIKQFDPEALYDIKKGLLAKLQERSAIVFPYRIFFE